MSTLFEEKVTSQLSSITASIANLATKEELARLATKEEIAKLATRDEMDHAIDGLAGAVKKGFDEIHFKIDRMDARFTNQLDYFHLWYPTRDEFKVLDDRISKVEKRIKT